MRLLKFAAIATAAVALAAVAPKPASAQVSFGINIGAAPACPYGYYNYAPYNCAPYGYYGPEWFGNGVFIGAGPWYHGGPHFHGHFNRAYDPRYGYHGGFPERGGGWHEPDDHWNSFHASHYYDGRREHVDHDYNREHGHGR